MAKKRKLSLKSPSRVRMGKKSKAKVSKSRSKQKLSKRKAATKPKAKKNALHRRKARTRSRPVQKKSKRRVRSPSRVSRKRKSVARKSRRSPTRISKNGRARQIASNLRRTKWRTRRAVSKFSRQTQDDTFTNVEIARKKILRVLILDETTVDGILQEALDLIEENFSPIKRGDPKTKYGITLLLRVQKFSDDQYLNAQGEAYTVGPNIFGEFDDLKQLWLNKYANVVRGYKEVTQVYEIRGHRLTFTKRQKFEHTASHKRRKLSKTAHR